MQYSGLTTRRIFLSQLGIAVLGTLTGMGTLKGDPKRILLRSSWQTVNIGDIAHTPGVLKLLETYLPDVEVYLWPGSIDNGVDKLLLNRFPKLKIVGYSVTLKEAFKDCDFFLHGSAASLSTGTVTRWYEETGKPYGIYGITFSPKKSTSTAASSEADLVRSIDVLSRASFVFFRDSKSLNFAKENGCSSRIMEFGPDGTFACDLRNEVKAKAFLSEHGLESGKFLCCIPRLRYTPYWRIRPFVPFDEAKHARNEEMKEHDHAPLRKAIIDIVNQTNLKVLICPEDQTQMRVGREMLLEKLPDDIRDHVVWRPNFWLTGEAISTYVRSAGLFGNELHSAIMCIGHGIPAIICRWEEQTWKGYMWEDIGLGDWLFDLDDEQQYEKVAHTVLTMAQNPEKAKAKAVKARQFVRKRQRDTMKHLSTSMTKY